MTSSTVKRDRPGGAAFASVADARRAVLGARGLLVDLDGTLIRASEKVEGADQFLRRFGDRMVILSNNSSDTEASLSARLARMSLVIPPERIVLAGVEMVRTAARRWPKARTLMISSRPLVELAEMCGLIVTQSEPELVLLGLKSAFDYRDLQHAANAIRSGARFVVANPDLTHPGPNGTIVPETGSIAAAVVASAGVRPDLVFGKPEPALFLAGLERLDIAPAEALMIGDNPDTDVLGASQLGIASVLLSHDLRLEDISVA